MLTKLLSYEDILNQIDLYISTHFAIIDITVSLVTLKYAVEIDETSNQHNMTESVACNNNLQDLYVRTHLNDYNVVIQMHSNV